MEDPVVLDRESLIDLGGGGSKLETKTVYWCNSTNPESMRLPWDCFLVSAYGESNGINRIVSTNGRTVNPVPGISGLSGGLCAVVGQNGNVPWYGRVKFNAGDLVFFGGSAVQMVIYLVFEIIPESGT